MSLAQRFAAMQTRHRVRTKRFEHALVRKGAVSLAAATFGAMHRAGVKPEIKGIPWKPVVWLGATLGEAVLRNPVLQAFAAGVSDAANATYVQDAIINKSFVAGDEI